MSIVDFNSAWFRAYAEAKLESDTQALPFYLKAALDATAEALTQQDLEDDQRKAILVAVEDLYGMRHKKPSRSDDNRVQSKSLRSNSPRVA